MAGSADPGAAGIHFQLYRQGPDGPVRWRILSGNNRDMGRGAGEYATQDECLAGIADFLGSVALLTTGLLRTADNRWAFRLLRRDEVMASSGHAFDRRTRCEQAARRLLEIAPYAEIRPVVAVLSPASWSRPIDRTAPVIRPNVAPRWSPVHGRSAGRSQPSGVLAARATPLDRTEGRRPR